MPLITCHECGHNVSNEAKSCPQCGVAPKKPKKTKWWLWAPLGIVVALFGIGLKVGSSPEAQAQFRDEDGIKYCWSEQQKKSQDPSVARLVAAACEKMESDYRAKYGRNP